MHRKPVSPGSLPDTLSALSIILSPLPVILSEAKDLRQGRRYPRHRHPSRRPTLAFALALAAAALASLPLPAQAQTPADTAAAVHLLSRATFGVRPPDVDAVLREGREAWLERQLRPETIPDDVVAARLAAFPTIAADPADMLRAVEQARREARLARADSGQSADTLLRLRTLPNPRRLLGELVTAKLVRAVESERQLLEVMTDFWFNHFNVYFAKGIDRYLVADYEAEAIRPHVFGRFEDMLRATARHPAMLFYLDNWTSAAPDSLAGARVRARARPGGRERGINENYARELLELHTLGVDGGYTQDDVVAVARAFTGWTFRRPTQRVPQLDVAFVFRPAMHDGGDKVVLGHVLPAGRGIEDGDDVIRMLAAHPATARFLAGKLVARFVTDEPAPELVDEIAGVWMRTDGDLRAVTRALFNSARFYDRAHVGAKVKSPFDLVASAFRVTGARVGMSRQTLEVLRALGQLPYNEPAPTGFPAMSEDWINSGALLVRMNFALDLAGGRIGGVRMDASRLFAADSDDDGVASMLAAVLPAARTDDLRDTISAELAAMPAPTSTAEKRARALGLALGSPLFQRR